MVKIRLKRFGAKRIPAYRVVVCPVTSPRQGRTLDSLGIYQPINPSEEKVKIDMKKYNYWIERGAQPTRTVKDILKYNTTSDSIDLEV